MFSVPVSYTPSMPRRSNREHLEALVDASAARGWTRPERQRVVILFTPRSGSSWFGDLLSSTTVLGKPDEFLNQDVNQEVIRKFGARTEADYLNALETNASSDNGVFSMEVIWGHLELSEIDLLNYYRDARFIYLRRKDILAQAVSLMLATETGVFHSVEGESAKAQAETGARLVSSEKAFGGIRRWWGHLQNYECLSEVQFAIRDIDPLRLYYEDLVEDPMDAVRRVRSHVGVPPDAGRTPNSGHTPVRSKINEELAKRFRSAQAGFIRKMEAFRPPLT